MMFQKATWTRPIWHPLLRLGVALGLGVAVTSTACGSDGGSASPDAASEAVGFAKPTAVMHANLEVSKHNWMDAGVADWSCLGTPTDVKPTAMAGTLQTVVSDFQNATPVANAKVSLFKNIAVGTVETMATADAQGKLTIGVPAGVTRFGFAMQADGSMDTLLLNQRVGDANATQHTSPAKIQPVSLGTAAALPALIGITRTEGLGIVAGALRDCQHREVSNFVATLSSTSGTTARLPNVPTYYFAPALGTPARPHLFPAASANGLFMIIEIPPQAQTYVQMWGYVSDADLAAGKLTLVSELAVPVLSETIVTGSFEPARQ